MTETLVTFLIARLDEDEAAAHSAAEWIERARGGGPASGGGNSIAVYTNGLPERQLREVEAKRKILAEHQRWAGGSGGTTGGASVYGVAGGTLRLVLMHLAAVYRDHPDYPADGL